jgi:hypothetical protein
MVVVGLVGTVVVVVKQVLLAVYQLNDGRAKAGDIARMEGKIEGEGEDVHVR